MVISVFYRHDGTLSRVVKGNSNNSLVEKAVRANSTEKFGIVVRCPVEVYRMDSDEILDRCRVKSDFSNQGVELEIGKR